MALNHRDDLLEYCERKLIRDPNIVMGRMMGHPGFKTSNNNKFFLFLVDDGMVLKLPPNMYEGALERDDVEPFQPNKDMKPMSTWIVWTCAEPDEYDDDWEKLAMGARSYTESEEPNKKKKKKS